MLFSAAVGRDARQIEVVVDAEGSKRVAFLLEQLRAQGPKTREVLLAQGRYRIEVRLKTEGVEPRSDEQGKGAGLRTSGGKRDNSLTGDADWQTIGYDFEVTDAIRDVELVTELRATKGRLWIEPKARLMRVVSQ